MKSKNKEYEIAIVQVHYSYSNYENEEAIIKSISDWSKVNEEELKLLQTYFVGSDNKIIIRRDTEPEFIVSSVKNAINQAKEKQRIAEEQKALAEKKKVERQLRKQAKTKEQELKLLEELQNKYKNEN